MGSGRTRSFDSYNQADVAAAIGRQPNHARCAKLFSIAYPARPSGEISEISPSELFRFAVLDQLLSAGCEEELARSASGELVETMGDDLVKGLEPGFVVCLKNLHSVVRVEYVPADPSGGYSNVEKLVNADEFVSVVQIDLGVLLEVVKKNLHERIEVFEESKRYPAEVIAEALRSAASLRDLIESAYK